MAPPPSLNQRGAGLRAGISFKRPPVASLASVTTRRAPLSPWLRSERKKRPRRSPPRCRQRPGRTPPETSLHVIPDAIFFRTRQLVFGLLAARARFVIGRLVTLMWAADPKDTRSNYVPRLV